MSDDGTDPADPARSAIASARSLTAVSRLPAQLYAARMRARERWRRLSITVTVTLVLLAVAAYIIIWHTPVLALTTVRVAGEKSVRAQQIVNAAALRDGTPLASLDTGAAAARVRRLPPIASASVSLDWPHGAVITVTERVPAALVPEGARYDVVDVSGVVFGVRDAPSGVLPVIRVQGSPAVKAAVVPGALAALKALAPVIVGQVTGISASSAYSIELTLRDGSVVEWGGPDAASAKAADLAALLRLGKAARYDVSAPEAPAMSGRYD
ncbi:FtsQ-type POTRA domain-containing protein [Actinocrinis puniceicyclus]|uniref:FtsQ-type POTRA domain-containing protein n=1 Tax=Actinocrinis puniceicyclus TaxID=977794 RepID=A0A8J7WPP9_9ACTN|nr:FtsQ-type POTRA domain-containing protein [Actinocrinis puniceicyclus]MBS2964062.1 FtsQ-type POTRA domain-containing protein [Actinocrinis puniceicyclus]